MANYYTPRELSKLGLIANPNSLGSESGNYQYILDLIKYGLLEADKINAKSVKPHYIITREQLAKYLNKYYK